MFATLWQEHRLPDLIERQTGSSNPYLEFLTAGGMRAGLYSLPSGVEEVQRAHADDKIYYVIDGEGWLRIGGQTLRAGPGAVLYVPAGLDHRFEPMTRLLRLLVVFTSSAP
jgi:mannose-6-phosphate isomerase-like protein (cupin superfamily)